MFFSVIAHFAERSRSRSWFAHVISSLLGAVIVMVMLWDADTNTKTIGIAWLIAGLGVGAYLRMSGRSLNVTEA
jgi:hypothetical protein